MPTYEYGCEACGNSWEVVQRITDAKLTDCPACGQPKARRLISGGNFVLKGGGWYADGYGNAKPSASSSSSGSSESSGSKTDSATKSDSSAKSDSGTKSEAAPSKASDSGSKSSD